MQRAARKDANHKAIVDAFRRLGWSVLDVSQLKNCCDIFVSRKSMVLALEIKDGSKPASATKLTKGEEEFLKTWQGYCRVIFSVDDVININQEFFKGGV
jgi:Holliday junction resolvase